MDGSETLLLSGANALPTIDAALECLTRHLDELNTRREEYESRAEERALAALAPPRPEDKLFGNARGGVSVPLETMLRLLNALPDGSPAREEALKEL